MLSAVAGCILLANFFSLAHVEQCAGLPVPALGHHVIHVGLVVAKEQVAGEAAISHVTPVQDESTVWNAPIGQFPGNDVDVSRFALVTDDAVAIRLDVAGPQPAGISLVDARPEAVCKRPPEARQAAISGLVGFCRHEAFAACEALPFNLQRGDGRVFAGSATEFGRASRARTQHERLSAVLASLLDFGGNLACLADAGSVIARSAAKLDVLVNGENRLGANKADSLRLSRGTSRLEEHCGPPVKVRVPGSGTLITSPLPFIIPNGGNDDSHFGTCFPAVFRC